MNLSIALQVALFLASIAFIALAVCVATVALQSRRRLESLVSSIETMTATVNTLAVNSGDMVRSINELTTRAQQHMDDVGHVVHSMRKWTDRAEPILETVVLIVDVA